MAIHRSKHPPWKIFPRCWASTETRVINCCSGAEFGDCFAGVDFQDYCSAAGVDSAAISRRICEKGLRYDLTVPFAVTW